MNIDLLFKQPLAVSFSSDQRKREKPQRQKKNSSKLDVCQVCGDKASIFNYGGLACQSCKVFFHRNGLCPKVCDQKAFYLVLFFTIFILEYSFVFIQQIVCSEYKHSTKMYCLSFC